MVQESLREINDFLIHPNGIRSLLILIITMLVAFFVSRVVAFIIIKAAQKVAVRSDSATDEEKKVQLRRVETYLSVTIALLRALIVGIIAFYTWRLLSPASTNAAATIGAGTFFIVIAGATIGMVLRDITAGSAMIIEQWFTVGEFIKVEPFMDVSGVVERMTLRSTKLRSLNGEVIWLHNQHIQGVHVTPNGVRTLAVDIFANNEAVGRNLIEKALDTMPQGTLKLTKRPRISRAEKWGDKLWYFTVVGQMAPGREWLMENFFIESLQELDARRKGPKTFVRPPISRHADEKAERSFKRAVRMAEKD